MIAAPGTTSRSIDVQIVDDSGLPVTSLVAATFPSVSWSLAGNTAATAITLSDLAAITSAYSSGGVKERSGGYYRLDVPNTALASVGTVTIIGEASAKHLIAEKIIVTSGVTAGVGAFAVTVKVTSDGTTPIAGASVRLASAGQNVSGITDVGGNASFNVNADTFTVSTMAVGFTSAPFTKTVDGSGHWDTGTGTLTVTLTAASLPAATVGHVTAFLYTRDGQGTILTNKTVSFALMDPLSDTDAWVTSKFTATSDGSTGLLTVQLLQNAKYRMSTSGGQVDFTTGTSSPFALPEVLGL